MQNIKAIFDIGNGYIKWAVFGEDDGNTVLLAKEKTKTRGLRKGKILDSDDITKIITWMNERFIKKLWGDFIDEAIVGLSHPEIQRERVTEHKRIMGEKIKEDDITHLSKVIHDISQKTNFETLKIMPVYWIVDETKKEKDPIDLQAKKLQLVADVFRIPKNFYSGLSDTFDKAWINVVDIVPNILVNAEATLDLDQKDLGTLLIDIGTNQTSYVVYEEWYPLLYGSLPIGSEDVTKDISIGLQIEIKEAERLKKELGNIIKESDRDLDTEIDLGFLSDIITARYEEIFEKINDELKQIERDGKLAGWVLLVGWGTKMENIKQLAKEIFKLAVFDAKDRHLHIKDVSDNKQFVTIAWLYTRSKKYKTQTWFNIGIGRMKNIIQFFKDLF